MSETKTFQEGFDEWVRRAANALSAAGPDLYRTEAPGSFSEAAAFLLSDEALAPGPRGYPALYELYDSLLTLLAVVYGSAYIPLGDEGDLYRIAAQEWDEDDDPGGVSVDVFGVLLGEDRDTLLFRRPRRDAWALSASW